MRVFRIVAVVAVVGGVAVGAATPARAVTTECRGRFHGTLPEGERFSGQVRPFGPRPQGSGFVRLADGDGTQISMHASRWLCRRDGGITPPHGGANIADAEGQGTLRAKNGVSIAVDVWIHVEDRGDGERNREDYFALRAADRDGNEVYFDANYLTTGSIDLIPVGAAETSA